MAKPQTYMNLSGESIRELVAYYKIDPEHELLIIFDDISLDAVSYTHLTGTANAIYQNLNYMETYNPEYVLILSGDHIYKMDYEVMLEFHKANKADITIATMPVPMEEASRFGVVITDENKRILEFEEKPPVPRSNLASMGIYIFSWKVLKDALLKLCLLYTSGNKAYL